MQTKIPPNFTQAGLTEAGLGNKKVLLSSNATPLEVRTSLYESFPKLERAGGFECLTGNGTTKCLVPIPLPRDGYSATSLHAAAKKARVYLRPIQNNINLDVPHVSINHTIFNVHVNKMLIPWCSNHWMCTSQLVPFERIPDILPHLCCVIKFEAIIWVFKISLHMCIIPAGSSTCVNCFILIIYAIG